MSLIQQFGINCEFIEWKINNIFPYPQNCGYFSRNILLSGASYYLKIYPNGQWNADHTADWVSVYLKRWDPFPTKRRISYTMGIRACDGSVFRSFKGVSEFQESDNQQCSGYGEARFVRTSKLELSRAVLSTDNSLTLFCIVQDCTDLALGIDCKTTAESAAQTESPKSIDILQENLKDLVLSGRHADVTFMVKDQQFQAHRSMLGARSRVFSAMFEHETEEKKTGVVNVDDCDLGSFKDFLTFLYTANLDVVSSSKAADLYKIAHKYDLRDLKERCVSIMAETLSTDSFLDVAPLAALYDESSLLESATEFFIKNKKTIFRNPKWIILLRDNLTLCNELLIRMSDRED